MGRIANFVQDKQFADKFNPTFDQFFRTKFPDYLSHVNVEERAVQLAGIDLIVVDKAGVCHTVDNKINRLGVSPDHFILEIFQDTAKGKPGWFVTGKAEYLAVGKQVENNYVRLYLVDKHKLKEWMDRNPGEVRLEDRDFSDRGGKATQIALVPTKHIQQFGLGPFWLECQAVPADVPLSSG